MKIIDEAVLIATRRLPSCDFCGKRLKTGFEACHILTRGRRGEKRIDLPWSVGAGCPPFAGNGCHRKSHDTGECVETFIANVAKRNGISSPEVLMEALKFLAWVPERPLAGTVAKRFAEMSAEVQALTRHYIEEKL